MKTLFLSLVLWCAGLPSLHAQSELDKVLDGLSIELDDDTATAVQSWIESVDGINFEWTDDFTAVERRKLGKRYEPLITVRSDEGRRFYVYGGRKNGTDELLLIAQLEASYVRVSLTGDFDFN